MRRDAKASDFPRKTTATLNALRACDGGRERKKLNNAQKQVVRRLKKRGLVDGDESAVWLTSIGEQVLGEWEAEESAAEHREEQRWAQEPEEEPEVTWTVVRVLDFAKNFSDLGDAIMGQVLDIVCRGNADSGDINPSAIREAINHLEHYPEVVKPLQHWININT